MTTTLRNATSLRNVVTNGLLIAAPTAISALLIFDIRFINLSIPFKHCAYHLYNLFAMNVNNEIKFVPKGWGFEKWIVNCSEYCGKLLYFVKGKQCSWHFHELKDEVFYVQSGMVEVKYSDADDILRSSSVVLGPGDSFHVYRGLRHRIIALQDSEVFEFSTQHFDSDSHRIIPGD